MPRFPRVLCLLTFLALTAFTVNADSFTYTFEAPHFTVGQVAPLTNRSPNIGSASFQATIVSDVGNSYQISTFTPNPLFSGQSLFWQSLPTVLRISFNMPINQVQFVWAQELPGQMLIATDGGDQSQDSADVGGIFQGGTFVFTSATSFTSISLGALGAPGGVENLTNFAIDNFTVTTPSGVPEPTTFILLGTGQAALTRLRKRSR